MQQAQRKIISVCAVAAIASGIWAFAAFMTSASTLGDDIDVSGKLTVGGQIQATGDICTNAGGGGAKCLSAGGGGGTWTVSGNSIYNNNTGNVGVGTTNPQYRLVVESKDVNGGGGISIKNTNSGNNSSANLTLNEGTGGSGFISIAYRNITATGNPSLSSDAAYFRVNAPNGVAMVSQNLNAPLTFQTGGISIIGGNSERMRITANGNVGIGTVNPTAKFDVNGDRIRIENAKTPASAADACTQGEIAWDRHYIYTCVATNRWKRAALSAW